MLQPVCPTRFFFIVSIKSAVRVVLMHYVTLWSGGRELLRVVEVVVIYTRTHGPIHQCKNGFIIYVLHSVRREGWVSSNTPTDGPPSRWKINAGAMHAARILFTFAHRGASLVSPQERGKGGKRERQLEIQITFGINCKTVAKM